MPDSVDKKAKAAAAAPSDDADSYAVRPFRGRPRRLGLTVAVVSALVLVAAVVAALLLVRG